MEYLMTYGWAILIIAIVLGVLYYLGVFNSATLAPRAQPGSCQVFRPNGAGTSFDIGLEGTCNDELPEYVAVFSANGYVKTPVLPQLSQSTVTGWVYVNGGSAPSIGSGVLNLNTAGGTYSPELDEYGNLYEQGSGERICCATAAQITGLKFNQWYMIAQTIDANGNVVTYGYSSGSSTPITATYSFGQPVYLSSEAWCIGAWECNVPTYYLSGEIANIQIYNTSLSQAEITALYDEGIGGAPIKPQNIVGWWPLNGNADDYSGDLNNGVSTGVTYTSAWTSGYTAP